jgi:hypothetical protein
MLSRTFRFARALPVAAAAFLATALASPTANAQGAGFVNFGIGPTIYFDGGRTQLHVSLQAGLRVARHLYVVFEPTGSFGWGFTVLNLPLGIEYDIPIRSVRNLYVYPRIMAGAGLWFDQPGTRGSFLVEPGFGVKYAIAGVWNIGFEPLDFPIYIADSSPFPTVAYRFTALTGFAF